MNNELKTKKFRIPNSEFRILNNSGASLLFVLAAMFLLLAIGTSVLVAAAASRGRVEQQAIHNQIMLLDESVHRTIMHSLHDYVDEDIPMQAPLDLSLESSLGLRERIILAVLEANENHPNLSYIEMTLEIDFEDEDFDDGVDEIIEEIILTIEPIDDDAVDIVQLGAAQPTIFIENWELDDDGFPSLGTPPREVTRNRIPETATVSFRLTVRVVLTIDDRTLESEAEYVVSVELADTDPEHLLEDGCSYPDCFPECVGIFLDYDDDPIGLVLISGEGTWELVSRGQMIYGIDPPNN